MLLNVLIWGIPALIKLKFITSMCILPKVGSRVVIQTAGVIMIVLGCLGKVGALFVTIPSPVVGGLFFVMFGEL